jgi:tRNA A37 threonylcarbamoyladenosine dehydratase
MTFEFVLDNLNQLSQKVDLLQKCLNQLENQIDFMGKIEIDFIQAEQKFNVSRSKLYKDIERGVISRTENGKLSVKQLLETYPKRSKRWNQPMGEISNN